MAYANQDCYGRGNSFAAIEAAYNTIKPVVSKNHTREADVRPVGRRHRTWERIAKVSKNCYVVYQHNWWWGGGNTLLNTPAALRKMAVSVKWERKGDIETVTIRAPREKYSTGALKFLTQHTPNGLYFNSGAGRCSVSRGGTDYPLPYSRVLPEIPVSGLNDYHKKKKFSTREDGNFMSFSRVIGEGYTEWEPASKAHDLVVQRRRVDIERKKALAPTIKAFKEWAMTMAPLVGVPEYTIAAASRAEIKDALGEEMLYSWGVPFSASNSVQYPNRSMSNIVETIMREEQHPLRVILLQGFLKHAAGYGSNSKSTSNKFNAWVNMALDLTKKVDVVEE